MKREYRVKEVTRPQRHFVVEERTVTVVVKTVFGNRKIETYWRTVMIPYSDMEGNDCERENYHSTLETAKKLINQLKEPKVKYHY